METNEESVKRLRSAIDSLDPEYLHYLRGRASSEEGLWLLRALLGVELPGPMDFSMLISYARSTGRGEFSQQDLEKIFHEQMGRV